jgi:methionyl-tRNA formyltransferase
VGLPPDKEHGRGTPVLFAAFPEKSRVYEEAILDYLETHSTIRNKTAREITHISADYCIKNIFGSMVQKGLIEQVPNTRTGRTAYRKPQIAP